MTDQLLRTLADLKAHEVDVLQAIRSAPNGSNLFLADPFRFLREHGFAVQPTLVQQLTGLQPKLAVPNTALYDRIRQGNARPSLTIHIRSLGLANVQEPTP
jgi:hypothetical protein